VFTGKSVVMTLLKILPMAQEQVVIKLSSRLQIGLLQQTVTWYKIRHTGGQAHYYSRTGTLKQRQVKLDWLWSLCFNVPMRE